MYKCRELFHSTMSDFFNNTVFLDTVTQDSIFYGLIVYIHKGLELCLDKFLSLVFHCSTILHVLGVKKYLMKKYIFFFFTKHLPKYLLFKKILLEDNCFTILCRFLPYISMNQPQVPNIFLYLHSNRS